MAARNQGNTAPRPKGQFPWQDYSAGEFQWQAAAAQAVVDANAALPTAGEFPWQVGGTHAHLADYLFG